LREQIRKNIWGVQCCRSSWVKEFLENFVYAISIYASSTTYYNFSIPWDLGFLPEHSLGMFSMQHLEALPRSQIKLYIPMLPLFWGIRFGYIHFSFPQFLIYWGRKTSHMKWGEVMTVWQGKDRDLGSLCWCTYQTVYTYGGKWYLRSVARLSIAGQLLFLLNNLIVLSSNNRDWIQTASYFADHKLWGDFFTFRHPFLSTSSAHIRLYVTLDNKYNLHGHFFPMFSWECISQVLLLLSILWWTKGW